MRLIVHVTDGSGRFTLPCEVKKHLRTDKNFLGKLASSWSMMLSYATLRYGKLRYAMLCYESLLMSDEWNL